jgi:hypothetical protein
MSRYVSERRISLSNQVSLPTSTMQKVMLPKWPTRSKQSGTWESQMGEMSLIRECSQLGESSLMGECTQGRQRS